MKRYDRICIGKIFMNKNLWESSYYVKKLLLRINLKTKRCPAKKCRLCTLKRKLKKSFIKCLNFISIKNHGTLHKRFLNKALSK